MKKFWIRLAVYMAGFVAIAWGNYAVLLHFHPLAYYYTPAGMLITAAVAFAESLVLWPVSFYVLKHWIFPACYESLADDVVKFTKESIVTEFKKD